MAKAKQTTNEESVDQIEELLNSKAYKGKHLGSRSGEEVEMPDLITTGSLFFDQALGGGYRSSGWARFFAPPECGKTSMSLSWAREWQKKYPEDGMVIAFNAEGRITADLIARSGILKDKEKFRIIDTNMSEVIWGMIENLIFDNPAKKKYFFIVDSTDACVRAGDAHGEKEIGDSEKIGGSATILSAAGKRLSLLFNLKNHFLFMTSQVRDKLTTGPAKGSGKDASGGNAPKFYSSLTGEIKQPWSATYIYDVPSDTKSQIIGRMVEIKLHKTPNEKSGVTVTYPVKYGLVGGVWRAYEALLLAQAWEFIRQDGAIFTFADDIYKEIKELGIDFPQKCRGEKTIRDFFDSCPEIVEFFIQKIKDLV